MNESLNTTVMKMLLLREDAGLSAGGGQVDGIGIGPKGEPGGVAPEEA